MSFKFISDTFSVARDADHFVQLKTLKSPKSADQIWIAIEVVGDSRYARSVTQNIIDTIEESYFSPSDLGAYERFEQALKEVNIIIKNLKEKRKNFGDINAIVAAFSDGELHLTQSRNAEAYLIRRNKFSMISEGLSSRSNELFVNIASGEISPDDKLIFSTTRLLRLATHSQIAQLFKDGVAEAAEGIRELTSQDENLSLGVMTIHTKLITSHAGEPADRKKSAWLLAIKQKFNDWFGAMPERLNMGRFNLHKKNILIALAAVIGVLFLSVSFLMSSQRNKAIREEYRMKIEALNQDLNVANTKGYANDKEGANVILAKIEEEARGVLDSGYYRAETLDLIDKVQEARDNINNTDRLKKLAPYVDLTVKKEDIKSIGITSLNDNFFVYEFNRFYEIILDQVLEPRVIDETEAVIAATAIEDQDVLAFLTRSGRVIEYENGRVGFANTADQVWKSGVDIKSFGRNIYILNPDENQIYKYSRNRSSYSNANAYSKGADLSGALSMAIDGSVYVLKEGGNIIRIYKGKQEQFRLEDAAVDLSESTRIFTTTELENLYLLDPVNKRVVILTKSDSGISRYYGQLVFEDLENIKDFYVEKNESKLYLLTDKEVYKVDI